MAPLPRQSRHDVVLKSNEAVQLTPGFAPGRCAPQSLCPRPRCRRRADPVALDSLSAPAPCRSRPFPSWQHGGVVVRLELRLQHGKGLRVQTRDAPAGRYGSRNQRTSTRGSFTTSRTDREMSSDPPPGADAHRQSPWLPTESRCSDSLRRSMVGTSDVCSIDQCCGWFSSSHSAAGAETFGSGFSTSRYRSRHPVRPASRAYGSTRPSSR